MTNNDNNTAHAKRQRERVVAALINEYDADTDADPKEDTRWVLMQFNGGRAPDEKWLTMHATLEAACGYAARDPEWRPELLVDLSDGACYDAVSTVTRGDLQAFVTLDDA
jgi:hypothetical protein